MSVRKRRWTTRTGEEKEVWVVDYVGQTDGRHLETFAQEGRRRVHAQVNVDVRAGIHTATSKSITVAEAARAVADLPEGRAPRAHHHRGLRVLLRRPRLAAYRRIKLAPLVHPVRRAVSRRAVGERNQPRPWRARCSAALKSLLRDAQRRGHVAQNVATSVSIRANARDRKRLQIGVDVPTIDEVKAIIEAAHGRARAVLITACLHRPAISELRGLRWQDVEIDGDTALIHVRQRADRFREIGRLKSASGERDVPIRPFVANTLRSLRALEVKAELVFANAAGKSEFHQTLSERMLGRAQLKAGVTVERDGKL